MRRILPDRPLTSAETTRRWRQRERDTKDAARVAADLATLPDHIDPDRAAPVLMAWYGRGFRYPPTHAQLSALSGLTTTEAVSAAVRALHEAPRTGPAYGVWGAVLAALQELRARVVASVRDAIRPPAMAHALRLTDHPDRCATCGRPPSVRYHDGSWGFPCAHAPIREAPPPTAPRYPPEDSPGMRAWREVGDKLRKLPKA